MPDSRRQSLFALCLVLAVAGGTAVGFWWLCARRPDVRFLPEEGPAEWIVYPAPAWPNGQTVAEQRAVFRQSFVLERVPAAAVLRVRGFMRVEVRVNGTLIDFPAARGPRWKEVSAADVAGQLRAGDNEVVATVSNDAGPPALWLALRGDDLALYTDAGWEVALAGSVPRPARSARAPVEFGPGNLLAAGEETVPSLVACWPALALFAGLSLAALIALTALGRRPAVSPVVSFVLTPYGALAAVALLWVVLAVHNLAALPFPVGHDHEAHLAYVGYIQERRALPLADEGVEMHQPPLYYLVSAAALTLCGLSPADPGAVVVLRLLSLGVVLTQCALLLASLRLIFPGRPRPQVVGLLLGAFLPAQLCLAHYPTNELLLGALGTGAVYLCLRIFPDPRNRSAPYLALGACLGAALLTKVTAVVVAGVVLAVLTGRLAVRGERRPATWLRTVGAAAGVCLLVSGWHFWRVASRFGTPFVGSYDPTSGFNWWMAPGYATPGYLFRFGSALHAPFFSVFHSFPDGLYSTLWGDGLWGGAAGKAGRPPWRYDLMAAGYLLALGPTLAVAAGLVAAVIRLVRRPSSQGFLLVGLAVSLGAALAYHFLRYPYLCHVKAFYALSGLVPLAAFGAEGVELPAARRPWAGLLVVTVLLTWALAAYFSFWVSPDSPETQRWLARSLRDRGRTDEAAACLRRALRRNPDDARLRVTYGDLLFDAGDTEGARTQVDLALRADPHSPGAHLTLSLIHQGAGRPREAIDEARRATEVAPEDTRVWPALAHLLTANGETEGALDAVRRGLGVAPYDGGLHYQLGSLLAKEGKPDEALAAFRIALCLQPRNPVFGNRVAWVLATAREERLRDAAEALRLSEGLCQGPGARNPSYLDTLAAAYASSGRFDRAVVAAQAAEAEAGRQPALAREIEGRLRLYRAGQPYRE
jgi:tetratricopeptide (TPR) repeat protein